MDNKRSDIIPSLKRFLTREIWILDYTQRSPLKAFWLRHLRIGILVTRRFIQNRAGMRASALVYATLLSLVPFLAVVFSLLKGFGYHNELEPLLTRFLYPLGEQAIQVIVPTIMNFVENARAAAVGGIGFLVFLISSLSVIKNLERAFNDIWKVEKKRRVYAHLFGILLIPLAIFIILTVAASLRNYALVEMLIRVPITRFLVSKGAPLILTWFIFLFFLHIIPNTKVRLLSSLYGAILAGCLWQLLNFAFASFFVGFYNKGTMAAVYASFVVLPIFLIWLYFSWMIVFLGAEMTYVHQNLHKITWETQSENVSWRLKETATLKTILFIGHKFFHGQKAPTQRELAEYLNVPEYTLSRMLSLLPALGLVNVIGRKEPRYVPAKSLEAMSLLETMEKLRAYGALFTQKDPEDPISRVVEDLQGRHEKALKEVFADTEIRTLLHKIDSNRSKS
jgi:membrane protein